MAQCLIFVFSYSCTQRLFASVLAEPAEAQCDVLMARRQHKHSWVLINRCSEVKTCEKVGQSHFVSMKWMSNCEEGDANQ